MQDDRLTLLGQSADDLPAISALMQDAILRAPDIGMDRAARRLVLLVNRFRHEASAPSRVRSALRIETVAGVQRRNWPAAPDAVLVLLAIAADETGLTLRFSGGAALRVQVEVIDIMLEDLAAPWPTARVPQHADDA